MSRPTKRPHTRNLLARKVIPVKLRPIFNDQTEFVRSTGTAEPADAKRLNAQLLAEWEGQIKAAWGLLRGQTEHLSQRRILALCGEWYAAQVRAHEDSPGDPDGWGAALSALAESECDEAATEAAGDGGDYVLNARGRKAGADELLRLGIAADPDSAQRFALEFFRVRLRFHQTMARRAGGDYGPDEQLAKYPAPASGCAVPVAPLTAEELLAKWHAENAPADNTVKKYRGALHRIVSFVGVDDMRRISKADVVRFKEHRLNTQALSLGTVNDDITSCGTLCKWAVKQGLLVGNPFADMAPRPGSRPENPREGYDDADAVRILVAARSETGWKRWLPWLLAFSGARISEIVEMRRCDVRQDGGVDVLIFVPLAGRKGKNPIFQRMVPIHPAVVAEGFLRYVAGLPNSPDGPLFPDLNPAPNGTRTPTATNAHGRWVRRIAAVTKQGTAPSHSWRHRMQDELRKVRADPEVVDALTGRSNPRNAGAGYGRGFRGMPAEVLVDLRKIPSPVPPLAAAERDAAGAHVAPTRST